MSDTLARRITIELSFEARSDHPLQNMVQLERLLKAALENGVNTSDGLIPPVYVADVQVVGVGA